MEMLYTCSLESAKKFKDAYHNWIRTRKIPHPELDERFTRIVSSEGFRRNAERVLNLIADGVVPCVPFEARNNPDSVEGNTFDIICWCRRYFDGKSFDVRF